MSSDRLRFSPGNAKLGKRITKAEAKALGIASSMREISSISLSSGYACPGARNCYSRAVINPLTGKVRIVDGKHTQFRCFSASQEVRYRATRDQRSYNFRLVQRLEKLGGAEAIADRIVSDLPKHSGIIRIHIAGDFYSQAYLDAWILVVEAYPDRWFYSYTKSLVFWSRRLDSIPPNLVLTASLGGKHDRLIDRHDLKHARVVYSAKQAAELNLTVDHDDRIARDPNLKEFALLLHGPQPKGSEASRARSELKKVGFQGYTRR